MAKLLGGVEANELCYDLNLVAVIWLKSTISVSRLVGRTAVGGLRINIKLAHKLV